MGALQGYEGYESSGFDNASTFSKEQPLQTPRQIYREDYGWKMTDDQYREAVEGGKSFEKELTTYEKDERDKLKDFKKTKGKEIETYQQSYDDAEKLFNKQFGSAQKNIDKAWKTLGKVPTVEDVYDKIWSTDQVPVRIVNGNNVESTTMMPRKIVDQMNSATFNQGEGSFTGNYVGKGQYYNVDVSLRGTGEKYGKELRDMITGAYDEVKKQFVTSKEGISTYNKVLDTYQANKTGLVKAQETLNTSASPLQTQLNTAKTNLELAKVDYNTALTMGDNSIKSQLDTARGTRQKSIDTYAQRYKDRMAKIKAAYTGIKEDAYGK